MPGDYPIIVIDDITDGRIVASAEVRIMPSEVRAPGAPQMSFLGDFELEGRAVLLDPQFTGVIPTASSMGVNGIVTDLSLIGTLTGDFVETRHIMVVDPISTALASGLAYIFG